MMKKVLAYGLCGFILNGAIQAGEASSQLFKELNLLYSDSFDGELNAGSGGRPELKLEG